MGYSIGNMVYVYIPNAGSDVLKICEKERVLRWRQGVYVCEIQYVCRSRGR